LVMEPLVLQAATVQLLFHQAHGELLFALGLVEIALKLARAFAQFVLGLDALGNVADDADRNGLVVEVDLGNRDRCREAPSVAVLRFHLALNPAATGADTLGQIRDQRPNALAEQFAARPTEYTLG